MPLNDHFHPPLSQRRSWTSFHASWATYIAEDLNERLPPRYFAAALAKFGIEIDVATGDESGGTSLSSHSSGDTWSPSPPSLVVPFAITADIVEVQIFHDEGGAELAGAIELVSPSNKDRPESREAFVAKCAAYLDQGSGLTIVDVVTERRANLHQLLLTRVSPDAPDEGSSTLYAVAYRPVKRDKITSLEIWHENLALGQSLPTLPLWLRGGICLPVNLEATYETTIRKHRVLGNGG